MPTATTELTPPNWTVETLTAAPQAYEDQDAFIVVIGSDDPKVVADVWNRYNVDTYDRGTEEYDTGFTTRALVAEHWRIGYVALPLPGELEPLDILSEPGEGLVPIAIADRGAPALNSIGSNSAIYEWPFREPVHQEKTSAHAVGTVALRSTDVGTEILLRRTINRAYRTLGAWRSVELDGWQSGYTGVAPMTVSGRVFEEDTLREYDDDDVTMHVLEVGGAVRHVRLERSDHNLNRPQFEEKERRRAAAVESALNSPVGTTVIFRDTSTGEVTAAAYRIEPGWLTTSGGSNRLVEELDEEALTVIATADQYNS